MSIETYRTLQHGEVRIRVEYDDCPCHPWLSADMACGLACWDRDGADFMPWRRHRQTKALMASEPHLETKTALMEWISDRENHGRPYLVKGIQPFDKYGGYVLGCDLADKRATGAIFIDAEHYTRFVDRDATDDEMRKAMPQVIQSEFADLDAWSTGSIFGFIVEKVCRCCKQWAPYTGSGVDSCWGFMGYKPDPTEMLLVMAEHWDSENPDIAEIIKQIKEGKYV